MAAIIRCSKIVGAEASPDIPLGNLKEVRDNPAGKFGEGLEPGRLGSGLPGGDLEGQKGGGMRARLPAIFSSSPA
jgi:hypothetical protein